MLFVFPLQVSAAGSRYYIDHLKYASELSTTHQQLNTEILETAYHYMEETDYFPNKDAGAMYLVAATSQENKGSGDENIFSNLRVTAEVYEEDSDALKGFSTYNRYGLSTYTGYYVGPLSLSSNFLKDSIIPAELGYVGSEDSPRQDITGAVGDRANWYDTCNMAAYMLDSVWLEYFLHDEYSRGFDKDNKYAVVALTAMAMHQGSSLLTQEDNFMPQGQAENATPQFWFDWCNLLTQEKYVDFIRTKARQLKPSKYNNDQVINDEIVIPVMRSAGAEALQMRDDFFSDARYQAGRNWLSGGLEYNDYVGSQAEKTSAALKVLASYIIMEERYQGAW